MAHSRRVFSFFIPLSPPIYDFSHWINIRLRRIRLASFLFNWYIITAFEDLLVKSFGFSISIQNHSIFLSSMSKKQPPKIHISRLIQLNKTLFEFALLHIYIIIGREWSFLNSAYFDWINLIYTHRAGPIAFFDRSARLSLAHRTTALWGGRLLVLWPMSSLIPPSWFSFSSLASPFPLYFAFGI